MIAARYIIAGETDGSELMSSSGGRRRSMHAQDANQQKPMSESESELQFVPENNGDRAAAGLACRMTDNNGASLEHEAPHRSCGSLH